MAEISDNMLQHIKESIEEIKYGRVTVEVNESRNSVDVVTESRKRFTNENKGKNFRNG